MKYILITEIEILNTQAISCAKEFREGWLILIGYKERLHSLHSVGGRDEEIKKFQCLVDGMVDTLSRKMMFVADRMSKMDICLSNLHKIIEIENEQTEQV